MRTPTPAACGLFVGSCASQPRGSTTSDNAGQDERETRHCSRFGQKVAGLLWLALLFYLSGCASAHAPQQNVILINRSGMALAPEGERVRQKEDEQEFEAHLNTITNAIAICRNCITRDGTKRILIFIHGGMNSVNNSLAKANELVPRISADEYYPLFINWNSGLWSSYWEHLTLVRQGEVQRVWGPLTSPLYLAADLGRAIVRAPVVWYYQLTSDATTAARYETPGFVRKALFLPKLADDAVPDQAGETGLGLWPGKDRRSDLDRFGYGTAYFLTLPLKLAVGPVIDALGKSAWDNMSRRTQTMFRNPGDFDRPARKTELGDALSRVGRAPHGAVSRLMQRLEDLIAADSANHYEITLIGHSMGAIVANEIIRSHPRLPFVNLVYMGAACSVSDFERSVVPYLSQSNSTRFYNLTLHPVAEAREAQWSLLDIPPRGSLLEWIDNYLSTPRTIPERTLGKWDNVIATTALIPQSVASRIQIKAFDVGPRSELPADNPQKHAEFSEVEFWKDQFWRIKPR
ncbi:MAG TPA: hypothetical protein VN887_10365 [Candidatus Angelobacter sp.]|nr:hypothetical protein [Candidatus Angelobacter sp.]